MHIKNSARNLSLALGFYSITIFPSYYSLLLDVGSIRIGLIIGIIIFFLLATPFGLRYFITPKIIVINITIFILILLSYLVSLFIFPGVDHLRFILSLILLFSISVAAILVIKTLDVMENEYFHKTIIFGFYFLLLIGYFVFIRKFFFNYDLKDFLIFNEASHFSICFGPFLFYAAYSSSKKFAFLYIIATIFLALTLSNLTLLVTSLMVLLITFGSRQPLLFLLFIPIFFLSLIYLDTSYFLSRLSFSTTSDNTSVLVFLSGWERAYLGFFDSFGFGVGFQQIGIVGPQGELQPMMVNIHRGELAIQGLLNPEKGLNWNDGGSVAPKIVTEFGFLGIISILLYCYIAIRILMLFFLNKIEESKNIFFFGAYLIFSIELFVRSVGYFSMTSFIFISSLYWIYLSQKLISQRKSLSHD